MKYQSIDLFDGINKDDCDRMLTCFGAYERRFKAGDVICDFEKPSGSIGVIQSGRAELIRIDAFGSRAILEELEQGSVFGMAFTFSDVSRDSMNVVCAEDSIVLYIDYWHVTHECSNVCTHHSVLLQNLLRLMAEKAFSMSQRIEVLSRRSIRDKLLCYFSICALRAEKPEFTLPFSVSALADYICSDRSAMMREMKNMREEGLIETSGRRVKLLEL
jgi:CRP/FNR family transcriptional regulator, anaerobic regulatory protein